MPRVYRNIVIVKSDIFIYGRDIRVETDISTVNKNIQLNLTNRNSKIIHNN